jgi:hypothetical protein
VEKQLSKLEKLEKGWKGYRKGLAKSTRSRRDTASKGLERARATRSG